MCETFARQPAYIDRSDMQVGTSEWRFRHQLQYPHLITVSQEVKGGGALIKHSFSRDRKGEEGTLSERTPQRAISLERLEIPKSFIQLLKKYSSFSVLIIHVCSQFLRSKLIFCRTESLCQNFLIVHTCRNRSDVLRMGPLNYVSMNIDRADDQSSGIESGVMRYPRFTCLQYIALSIENGHDLSRYETLLKRVWSLRRG